MSTEKLGIKDLSAGRSDVYKIDPRKLHVRADWNIVRDRDFDPADEDDLALAQSIAASGVKEALTGQMGEDGLPYVTNGHRRLAATMYAINTLGAEVATVPFRTEERQATEADRVLSMILRNDGKPVSPLGRARVYKKLADLGWTEEMIAARVGRTKQQITAALDLQAAPAEIVDMVQKGDVSATLAQQTIRKAKGDGTKATAALKAGVESAKASGKKKATAKHVAPKAEDIPVIDPKVENDAFQAACDKAGVIGDHEKGIGRIFWNAALKWAEDQDA